MRSKYLLLTLLLVLAATVTSFSQDKQIPAHSKVFIGPMKDQFDTYLREALESKKVPLNVVNQKELADFELTGTSESKKAGTAKKLILGSWHSSEQASVTLVNLKSGIAVWAYSVNKSNSAHGKKTTAESCAKHLKEKIESKK